MRLPKLNAELTLNRIHSSGLPLGKTNSIEPAFSIGGIFKGAACFAKCGLKALGCLHCGTSPLCWAQCAGPETLDCVETCF